MTTSDPLHMLQLSFDPRQLAALGQRERLPPRQDDVDYLVHALLSALFGESSVQPFRVMGEGSRVQVLGYSSNSGDELKERAATFAEPADYAACDWPTFASKEMPRTWQSGRRLGYQLRACPVVRLAKEVATDGKDGRPLRYHRGAEIDAWVHRRFLADPDGPAVSREEVYREWLGSKLDGAAALESAALEGFRRRSLVRKRQGPERKPKVIERPDVVMRGTLTVADSDRFHNLLAGGLGRHKAFGFGMLLVRAPE